MAITRQLTSSKDHRVVSVLVEGMSMMEIAVATEFFGDEAPPGVCSWYRHRSGSAVARDIAVTGGIRITTTAGPEAIRHADTVIIPGWSHSSIPPSPELAAELRRAAARGARLVSFCTGAFAL